MPSNNIYRESDGYFRTFSPFFMAYHMLFNNTYIASHEFFRLFYSLSQYIPYPPKKKRGASHRSAASFGFLENII